jgi:ATP-binding cassette, subfamily B, bacterial
MHARELDQQSVWLSRFRALRDLPRLLQFLWHSHPLLVASALLLRLLTALTPLAMLWSAKEIIDRIAAPAHEGLWLWIGIEFGIVALNHALTRGVDFVDARLADEFTRSLSVMVMDHAARLDLADFEDALFHDQLQRARVQTTDRLGMLHALGQLIQRVVMLVSIAIGVFAWAPWLVLALLLCVLPAFLVESHFAFLGYSLAQSQTPARREMDYLLTLGSSREASRELRMFALAPFLRERFLGLSAGVMKGNQQLNQRRLLWGALLAVFTSLGYYAAYAWLAWRAASGEISLGLFTFLAGSVAAASMHLQSAFSLFASLADQALYLRDLMVFLDRQPRIASSLRSLVAPRAFRQGVLFDGVSFRYPHSEREVLNNLQLHLEPGQRVGLVGENGEGKSTLVKLLCRLYEPSSGRILLEGVDLRDYDLASLRSRIGVLFQDFMRFDMTLRDNIAAGDLQQRARDAMLREAAVCAEAEELIDRYPTGLEQMLGVRFQQGVDLSGGEWQRVALARAWLRQAPLLILDEPTAALDAAAEYAVFRNVMELTQGRMALLIAHRFSTLRLADRIVVLQQGAIREDGSHAALLAQGGQYARLFSMQAAGYAAQ